jgi:hypothetical protein
MFNVVDLTDAAKASSDFDSSVVRNVDKPALETIFYNAHHRHQRGPGQVLG